MFFYHLLWSLIGAPLLMGSAFKKDPHFRERLGLALPSVAIKGRTIWVHALSVGEVRSAIPLARQIKEHYSHRDLVFSSTTVQGLQLAREQLGRDVAAVVRMPVDFWWASRRVIRALRPELLVVVETDLWPGLLRHLGSMGAKAILVNGRISDRTLRSYCMVPYLARRLFADLRYCLMQTPLDRDRLLRIGVAPEKVISVGNIKFDHDWVPMEDTEKAKWFNLLGLPDDGLIWVAGSTHGEESKLVIDVFSRLKIRHHNLVLILAPRRIEEADHLVRLAKGRNLNCILRSKPELSPGSPELIILDTIGELSRIYGLGHIAFVGGSLIPFGGHNLLEPASFGLPVIFGPHTQNFAWMASALEEAKGGVRVKDKEELFNFISLLLGDSGLREQMGKAAHAFVMKNRGALARTLKYIDLCLNSAGGAQ